jgi:hypothetical protein
MHDEAARPLLAPLPQDERFASWHLRLADGSLTGHGRGGVDVLQSMHRSRAAGRLLASLPDSILDTLYGVLARHRTALGRLVPDGRAPRRYP